MVSGLQNCISFHQPLLSMMLQKVKWIQINQKTYPNFGLQNGVSSDTVSVCKGNCPVLVAHGEYSNGSYHRQDNQAGHLQKFLHQSQVEGC